jgi:hypothetical protein
MALPSGRANVFSGLGGKLPLDLWFPTLFAKGREKNGVPRNWRKEPLRG